MSVTIPRHDLHPQTCKDLDLLVCSGLTVNKFLQQTSVTSTSNTVIMQGDTR